MRRADNFCPDDSLVCGLPKNQLDNGSDEPMAPQNIPAGNSCVVSNTIACNSLKSFGLQFGAIPFDEKNSDDMVKFTTAGLSSNILFRGALLSEKDEKRKARKFISIGCMHVEIL